MTLDILKKSQIKIKYKNDLKKFEIFGNQKYNLSKYVVPGDYSSIAFILGAAAITNSKISIKNIDISSIHADKKIIRDLQNMGVNIITYPEKNEIEIKGSNLKGKKIYCGNSPDLIPILAVIGAYAEGKTILYGAEHVRYKESNRLNAITTELKKMGVAIKENKTGLTINGGNKITPADNLETYGDHRIFMALIIASLRAESPVFIKDDTTYKDSYPNFLNDLKKLGVKLEEQ